MQVKTKKGEIINVDTVEKNGTVTGTNAEGVQKIINTEEIIEIVNSTLTIWDLFRGLLSLLKKLLKR